MLNLKIKDYSRKGVVLFFCVFVVGVTLRFLNDNYQSANAYQIAHLYFSQHLDQIFFLDQQTPLRYLFLSLGLTKNLEAIRNLLSGLEFALIFSATMFIGRARSARLALLFFATWYLWPVNISSLELLAPSVMLIITLWVIKPEIKPVSWWLLLGSVQLLEPLTLLLVLPLVVLEFKRKTVSGNQLRFLLSTSLPVVIYYLAKLSVLGLENIFYPIPSLHFIFFVLPLSYLIFQKWQVSASAIMGIISVLLLYDLLVLRPWVTIPGDDQAVADFKAYTAELYERPVVICATIAQQDYYFKLKHDCQFEVLKHQLAKQEFYFFDLSGTRSDLVGFLKKNAPHVEEKKFHHASFLSVTY